MFLFFYLWDIKIPANIYIFFFHQGNVGANTCEMSLKIKYSLVCIILLYGHLLMLCDGWCKVSSSFSVNLCYWKIGLFFYVFLGGCMGPCKVRVLTMSRLHDSICHLDEKLVQTKFVNRNLFINEFDNQKSEAFCFSKNFAHSKLNN